MTVPWNNFAENPVWKSSVNLDFSLWTSSRDRWIYCSVARSIYNFEEEQQRTRAPKRERSPDLALERYYASEQYDRECEQQKEAERQAREESGYKFRIKDVDPVVENVDPEVMQMLEEHPAKRQREEREEAQRLKAWHDDWLAKRQQEERAWEES